MGNCIREQCFIEWLIGTDSGGGEGKGGLLLIRLCIGRNPLIRSPEQGAMFPSSDWVDGAQATDMRNESFSWNYGGKINKNGNLRGRGRVRGTEKSKTETETIKRQK